MRDYFPKPLPHGYGVGAIDPPEQKIPVCICGHSQEDHNEPDKNEYREALANLVAAMEPMLFPPPQWNRLETPLSEAIGLLCVCQHRGCECARFQEAQA